MIASAASAPLLDAKCLLITLVLTAAGLKADIGSHGYENEWLSHLL